MRIKRECSITNLTETSAILEGTAAYQGTNNQQSRSTVNKDWVTGGHRWASSTPKQVCNAWTVNYCLSWVRRTCIERVGPSLPWSMIAQRDNQFHNNYLSLCLVFPLAFRKPWAGTFGRFLKSWKSLLLLGVSLMFPQLLTFWGTLF